ncbi:AraC family transcriptional regulator [Halarcobacter ebronensis]|uniref:AraC family transcriptional regulator n=1 Tax=Halarcobacter ebronensis TaxID=1462615 RepID=A0A4V1M0Q3_9BACT|nr:AraC family transcriptional regulator [Halarcobacter ebronensis]QKF82495.1 transcriptional regulator, AraC family (GyrI domain) [Halarcobacter ebronensis]RXK07485.1 AraC family transcriptional regulator [Halarcobacter ebronensis]
MKKDTIHQREDIVNRTFYYIYKNLEFKITLDELAKINHVSKFHYHRIIKESTGKTLFEIICDERLKKAANLLITNTHSTISEIANKCGYISHSSFIKAFKARYQYTPKQWRNGKYKEFSKSILEDFTSNKKFSDIEPQIKVCKEIHCAYIRHKGYNKSIKKCWDKLSAIAYTYSIKEYKEIALFHDNPVITPQDNCSYVACISVDKDFKAISTFDIPESLYAVFYLKGVYGDVLNLIRYVYHYWLPNSGYEAKTIPAYAIYHKNYFLTGMKDFEIELFIPISVE